MRYRICAVALAALFLIPAVAWGGRFKPGDELWTPRRVGKITFHHSGVYIGNGKVVHANSTPAKATLRMLKGKHIVRIEKSSLSKFSQGKSVRLGPTRRRYPRAVVVRRALAKVGRGFRYDPLRRNCQHISSKIVSGTARSPEARKFKQALAEFAKKLKKKAKKKLKKKLKKKAKKKLKKQKEAHGELRQSAIPWELP